MNVVRIRAKEDGRNDEEVKFRPPEVVNRR